MISKDKVTEIFCIVDDFCKEYNAEIEKILSKPLMGVNTAVEKVS